MDNERKIQTEKERKEAKAERRAKRFREKMAAVDPGDPTIGLGMPHSNKNNPQHHRKG